MFTDAFLLQSAMNASVFKAAHTHTICDYSSLAHSNTVTVTTNKTNTVPVSSTIVLYTVYRTVP